MHDWFDRYTVRSLPLSIQTHPFCLLLLYIMSVWRPGDAAEAVRLFIIVNVGFIILFWLLRVPWVGNEEHFIDNHDGERPVDSPVLSSLYLSVLVQTTVGASDITPVSTWARSLTMLQCLTAMASVMAIATVFLARYHVTTAAGTAAAAATKTIM